MQREKADYTPHTPAPPPPSYCTTLPPEGGKHTHKHTPTNTNPYTVRMDSLLLFKVLTQDCAALHITSHIKKFTNDTNKGTYKAEVQ